MRAGSAPRHRQVVTGRADPSRRRGRSAGSPARGRCRSPSPTTVVAVAQVEQHDVDDPVGRLDLGPLVALEDVLDDQRMEAERARRPAAPGLRRRDEVDPDGGLRLAEELGAVPASAAVPSSLATPSPRMATTRIVPGWPGAPSRAVARLGRRAGSPARSSEGEAGFGRFEAIGVGSSGSGRLGRVAARPMRRPAYAAGSRAAAEDQAGGIATARHAGGHDEQADHDRGRLARRPLLERVDDERVAQRPVAQRLGDELQVRVRAWRRPRRRAGRWSSSRRRSGSPARPPCRSSGRRSRPPRPSRTPAGRPPRPRPSSAA